ncbi:hypothetical protein ACP70R_033221 [Stipagrostis hirtigluma subsp. patula]
MEHAAAQPIYLLDHVMFRSTGAHGDYGQLLKPVPDKRDTVAVLCAAASARALVVASASDLGGQFGVVTGVARVLDLVRLDGDQQTRVVAGGVSPADLRRVREFSLGDYVVSGPWLGRVVEVAVDVDVAFGEGAVCRVTQAEGKLRTVATDSLARQTNCVFYPGQRVVGDSSVFKASRWLTGLWKPTRVAGTIAKVTMASVLVYWVASSQLGTKSALVEASAPPAYQRNPGNLTYFCSPSSCFWSIGDRCFFRGPGHHAGESSSPLARTGGDHESPLVPTYAWAARRKKHKKWQARMANRRRRRAHQTHEFERPLLVANTHTTVDVLWQDGTRQRGVPSASLIPAVARNEHNFLPGQHVVRRPLSPIVHGGDGSVATGDDATVPAHRVGVVRSLDFKDQTVRVSWLKAAMEPNEVDYDETLSVYNLGRSYGHSVLYGDVVVRLRQTESSRDADGVGSAEEGTPAWRSKKKAADDLSWVGHVVDLCDGHVQVKWGDGNTSKVLPQEIAVVKLQRFLEMLNEMGGAWVYDDGYMEDVVDDAHVDTAQEPAGIDNDDTGEGDDDDSDGGSDGWVGTFIQAAIRMAGGVLVHGKRYLITESATPAPRSQPSTTENMEAPVPVSGGDDASMEVGAAAASASGNREGGGDGEESDRQGKAGADATNSKNSFRFQQFDVVRTTQSRWHWWWKEVDKESPKGRKNYLKRANFLFAIANFINPESAIAKPHIPYMPSDCNSVPLYAIHVIWAFEDRMDLLRAVMVGASGTPYQDGLFFFDLQLPPSYPAVPPSYPAVPPLVSYRSFGLRVNPNLYPSGTVCLSLLNTFDGKGIELWSPEASSVLQVLVSIQGLVLTAQPYYNESGYPAQLGTPEGRRNELPYSENTYLLNLQTMLHLLRRPPAGFEAFIRDHFRRHGRHVLRACESYLPEGLPRRHAGRGGARHRREQGAAMLNGIQGCNHQHGAAACQRVHRDRCRRVRAARPASGAASHGAHTLQWHLGEGF